MLLEIQQNRCGAFAPGVSAGRVAGENVQLGVIILSLAALNSLCYCTSS
jgi:hypothetical protein